MSDVTFQPEGGWAVARVEDRKCERCNDIGRRWDDRGTYIGRCLCQKPIDAVEAWNRARIPARYANAAFDTWRSVGDADPSREVRAIADILHTRGEHRGFLLVGPPGGGKTHLAVALVRHAVFEHRAQARFVAFDQFRHSMKRRNPEKGWAPADLAAVPLLVLDDVPVLTTAFERSLAGELIGRRYNNSYTTIITSNLRVDDLETMLEPSAASRLRGMCREIFFPGLDYRRLQEIDGRRK